MALSDDLTEEALRGALPSRPVRTYEAVVSTVSVAHGWANADAPDGAVVVAGHQLSPRGHAGRPLTMSPGKGLGFSLIMRPSLAPEREGWLYSAVLVGLADVHGPAATIRWPDELCHEGATVATTGVSTTLDGPGIEWAIADVLLPEAAPPRTDLLRRVLEAIEARAKAPAAAVLEDYDRRCTTLGRQVRARLLAGTGPALEGKAISTLEDGALLLQIADGRKAPVRPQDVRRLEPA